MRTGHALTVHRFCLLLKCPGRYRFAGTGRRHRDIARPGRITGRSYQKFFPQLCKSAATGLKLFWFCATVVWCGRRGGMADAVDSKSTIRKDVRVQVSSPAKRGGGVGPKKIVFLDIDGTLVGADGCVPDSAAAACRRARRRGHLLYLSSGRNMAEIGGEITSVGFDGIVSSGGARVETGGTVIFDAVMPEETVRRIAGWLEERRCGFALEKNHAILCNRHYVDFWESVRDRLEAAGTPDAFVTQILSLLPRRYYDSSCAGGSCRGVNKIVFAGNGSASFADVENTVAGACEIFRASYGGEIGPLGVHKGSALKLVAEHHGVDVADTVAFGDGDNDRPMIAAAGTGVAMGNASDALKALADIVTDTLADDGIFNGFKRLALI